nr:hypothetical protein CFP56_41370 [Quercus suber]
MRHISAVVGAGSQRFPTCVASLSRSRANAILFLAGSFCTATPLLVIPSMPSAYLFLPDESQSWPNQTPEHRFMNYLEVGFYDRSSATADVPSRERAKVNSTWTSISTSECDCHGSHVALPRTIASCYDCQALWLFSRQKCIISQDWRVMRSIKLQKTVGIDTLASKETHSVEETDHRSQDSRSETESRVYYLSWHRGEARDLLTGAIDEFPA